MSNIANPEAAAFAGVDAVEIKVTIRPEEELRAERALQVDEDTAEVRVIYFYETAGLALYEAGIALRARLVKGDDDDSTVKFRPIEPTRISPEWRALDDFKLEADWVKEEPVCAASLTARQEKDEIEKVAAGAREIAKLFSRDQERFLEAFAPWPVDYGQLSVMGPIRALRWKVKHDGFPQEMTVEEWRLPDGEELVEVSIKVPPATALAARRAFEQHLTSLGLDPAGAQESKTLRALRYFAGKLQAPTD